MSTPTPFLIRMGIFLIIIAIGVFLIYPTLADAFLANAVINGVILGVLVIGIVHAFRTVVGLYAETNWIQRFRLSFENGYQHTEAAPRLMASAATLLTKRSERGQLHISAGGMQTIMDGVGARLDESRETGRYMVGLLVFLGLLGTFWGLLDTVRSVGGVISGLDLASDNVAGAFENLKQGLQTPLSGQSDADRGGLYRWRWRSIRSGVYSGLAGANRRQPGEPATHHGAGGREPPIITTGFRPAERKAVDLGRYDAHGT